MRRYAVSIIQTSNQDESYLEVYCLDCDPGNKEAISIWTGKHGSMYKIFSSMERHETNQHPSKNKEN